MGFFDDKPKPPHKSWWNPSRNETHRQQSNGSWKPDNDLSEWDLTGCRKEAAVLLIVAVVGLSVILGGLGLGVWWIVQAVS